MQFDGLAHASRQNALLVHFYGEKLGIRREDVQSLRDRCFIYDSDSHDVVLIQIVARKLGDARFDLNKTIPTHRLEHV